MAKKKAKDATKKVNIFTLIFGVLMGILTLPIISLFPSNGNLSFWQYIGYLFIYSILVRIAINLFQKILIKKAGKNYNGDAIDTRFFSNVLYAITFVYYFIYAYLAARFAFHDTFLKKRVIDANDKAKFTKLIVFLLPLLYVVITVLFNLMTNEDFSTFSMFFQLHTIALLIVRFASMSLAIYINKKRIKTN